MVFDLGYLQLSGTSLRILIGTARMNLFSLSARQIKNHFRSNRVITLIRKNPSQPSQ